MSNVSELRIGSTLAYDGELCSIMEISADAVVLVTSRGRARRIRLIDLLKSPKEGGLAQLSFEEEDSAPELWGVLWAAASKAAREEAFERAGHIRELRTGFRSGTESIALPGEPKAEYSPELKLIARQRAKAAELGVSLRTIQRWCADYDQFQEPGLLDARSISGGTLLRNLDPRWLRVCEEVLNELTDRAKHHRSVVLGWIEARVALREADGGEYHGTSVRRPGQNTAYEVLRELERGRNLFTGSTKGKRSIKGRPTAPYGRLPVTRPGEYVLLDTNSLNVYALEPISGSWDKVELTVAMDVYGRNICGMRLSPRSTKSIDVASVLLETMQPFERPSEWAQDAVWPYSGVPDNLLARTESIHIERFAEAAPVSSKQEPVPAAPGMLPETIIVDHGKVYVSAHVTSLCARLGISIQPARLFMATDKSPLERFFRTIEALLQELPGYKGSSVDTRGDHPENDSVYTVAQLEQIIREWIATIYHHDLHDGLFDPQLPGVLMTPTQKHAQGVAVAGRLRMPSSKEFLLELLPVVMRNFNHYGVEYAGLRYTGAIVAKYQNRSRVITTRNRKWPFFVNSDDVSRIYFHDPDDGQWHTLEWERHRELQVPFNLDALDFAKKQALQREDEYDTADALVALLERLGIERGATAKEKLISARMIAQRDNGALRLTQNSSLFTVQRLFAARESAEAKPQSLEDELMDGSAATEARSVGAEELQSSTAVGPPDEDFYDDVMEDL